MVYFDWVEDKKPAIIETKIAIEANSDELKGGGKKLTEFEYCLWLSYFLWRVERIC